MKKQSKGHREDRQDVLTVTPFPGNSRTGTKPHGVHAGGSAKPTQLSTGAAESKTQPVQLPGHNTRQRTDGTQSSRDRAH